MAAFSHIRKSKARLDFVQKLASIQGFYNKVIKIKVLYCPQIEH